MKDQSTFPTISLPTINKAGDSDGGDNSTFAAKFKTIMGSKEKLVERFKKKPKDFTYE